jgi:hypothetical protein
MDPEIFSTLVWINGPAGALLGSHTVVKSAAPYVAAPPSAPEVSTLVSLRKVFHQR